MANLSNLSLSSLALALVSVALGDVLAALAMNHKQGDSVDGESFVDMLNDLAPSAVDVANSTLAETRAIDVLVRREVAVQVLSALTASASKGDKATGANKDAIHASLLKTLVTQATDVANLNFKELSDTIDAALSRCIASKRDDGTFSHDAPFYSSKGKGGVKPTRLSASVLAAQYNAEYQAFVKEQEEAAASAAAASDEQDSDESQDEPSDESQDTASDSTESLG